MSLILTTLKRDEPTSENDLTIALQRHGLYDDNLKKRAVSTLHDQNKIRWVAFRGWCFGGRPEIEATRDWEAARR